MKKVISTVIIAVIAAVNLNLTFNSDDNSVNLCLANIMALARSEYYGECSFCGDDVLYCNCEFGITCDHADCWLGKSCHSNSFNWACPCYANGNPFSFCV